MGFFMNFKGQRPPHPPIYVYIYIIYIYYIYIIYIYIIYNYKQVIRKKFGKGAKKISKMEAQGLPSSSRIEIFFAPFAKKPS